MKTLSFFLLLAIQCGAICAQQPGTPAYDARVKARADSAQRALAFCPAINDPKTPEGLEFARLYNKYQTEKSPLLNNDDVIFIIAVQVVDNLTAARNAAAAASTEKVDGGGTVSSPPIAKFATLSNGAVLFDAQPQSTTNHVLNVTNGGNSDAIVKLIDARTKRKVLSLAVSANSSASHRGIPEGSYILYFAFGGMVHQATNGTPTDRFDKARGFARLDKRLDFQTTEDNGYTYTAEHTITVTPVIDGNVTDTSVSQAEFENW